MITDRLPEGVHMSRRELETFEWLLTGKSEKEIAVALDLSTHTVHQYVKSVYKKLGVHTRAELMAQHLAAARARARPARLRRPGRRGAAIATTATTATKTTPLARPRGWSYLRSGSSERASALLDDLVNGHCPGGGPRSRLNRTARIASLTSTVT